MTDQLDLKLEPITTVLVVGSLSARFEAFHSANSHVYRALKKLTRSVLKWDRKVYGIAGLFEVLRWNYALETSGDVYMLNNDFRAFYARLLNADPDLEPIFICRSSEGDGWIEGYLNRHPFNPGSAEYIAAGGDPGSTELGEG